MTKRETWSAERGIRRPTKDTKGEELTADGAENADVKEMTDV
jgi:hypothetical protein